MSADRNQLNVLHVTPAFYPATYWGGPIYSVYGLCNALAKTPNILLRVLTTDASGPAKSDRVKVTGIPMVYQGNYEVFFCSRWWLPDISPGMLLQLWPMIRWADVVHLTGVYSPPTIPTLLICRLLGKPVIWSPRGALQRWDHATKLAAKWVWEQICRLLVNRKSCIMHVTSEEEAAESKVRIPNTAMAVVPNGVDIPDSLPSKEWMPERKLRVLYLGRLHPIKGIENLLHALALMDETVTLSICGNGGSDYTMKLRTLIQELHLERRVSFYGHVDGAEKRDAFMQADVCVVPSFSENFGMVVAESLAHGVPVIASRGTPWAELEKRGCGLWVDNSPQSLAAALSILIEADLAHMGLVGREWMKAAYSWRNIAAQMFARYHPIG